MSSLAMTRLDELNLFLHTLIGRGLWMDRDGLLTALPSLGGATAPVHVYVELPELHFWPSSADATSASTRPATGSRELVSRHPFCAHLPVVQSLLRSTEWASPETVVLRLDASAIVVARYLLSANDLDPAIRYLNPAAVAVHSCEPGEAAALTATLVGAFRGAARPLRTLRAQRHFIELLHLRCLFMFDLSRCVFFFAQLGALLGSTGVGLRLAGLLGVSAKMTLRMRAALFGLRPDVRG